MPDGLKRTTVDFRADGAHLVAASLDSPRHQKIQTLEFDSDILCSSCDCLLGEYDRTLIEFVRDWYHAPVRSKQMDRFRPAPKYCYNCETVRLKLAFAAIMFRYSVSRRYPGAKIGTVYEETFSKWLSEGRISGKRRENLKIWIFGTSKEAEGLCSYFMLGPAGDRFIFTIEMFGLIIFVNIGGRPAPDSIVGYPEICDSPHSIQFPIVPFEQSHLAEIIRKMARLHASDG